MLKAEKMEGWQKAQYLLNMHNLWEEEKGRCSLPISPDTLQVSQVTVTPRGLPEISLTPNLVPGEEPAFANASSKPCYACPLLPSQMLLTTALSAGSSHRSPLRSMRMENLGWELFSPIMAPPREPGVPTSAGSQAFPVYTSAPWSKL